jgi:hypothetical protein
MLIRASLAPLEQQKSLQQTLKAFDVHLMTWLRGLDLNQRPLGYEPNELPDCSTPRLKN